LTEPAAKERPFAILALPAFKRRDSNPFQALLYEPLVERGVEVTDWTFGRAFWRTFWRPVDLWHLHHPDTVVFPRRLWQSLAETILFRLLLSLAKWRGIKILWTVHDLDSSDGLHPRLESWFWRYFLPRIDGHICLSESGRQLACARFPILRQSPSWIVQHGDFRDAYPSEITRAEARRRLEIPEDALVLLSFGLIRPYKEVPSVVRTFLAVENQRALLLVAGRVYDTYLEREIRESSAGSPRVRLELRWIPFEETQIFFVAADLVVLSYRRILNSGTLMLALSFGRPVLAPAKGALLEQQARFGTDWVRLYQGELDRDDLADAIAWARAPRAGPPDLDGLDWNTLATETYQIYRTLITGAGR
jgi:glycosyltransferase involved in cell wall biosynthesis